jgi:predicted metal-dependent peptidase
VSDPVAAARLWAVSRVPYLARAVFACPVRTADSGTVSISRSWAIDADPSVVARLDVDELGRLLVHLVGHAIRDHAGRADHAGVRNEPGGGARWNRAADAEINDDLVLDGLVPAVAPELPGDLGCEAGELAEHYFRDGSTGPRHWDCGSGTDGEPRECERPGGLGDQQLDLVRLSVAADIQRQHRLDPGSVAAGWQRWAETVLPSRTDWRRVLAAEIRSAVAAVSGNVDYTYRRPSRRGGASPRVVLPSMYRPVPEVAVVCDTSGSMDEVLLARALAEVEGLLTRAGLRAARLRVLAVDTAVHAVRRVTRAGQVVLAGGGGTDMGAGIEAAAALRPRPSVIVVLTDGFTPWPDTPPRGCRVVVGLLAQDGPDGLHDGLRGGLRGGLPDWDVPAWARTVVIPPDSGVS